MALPVISKRGRGRVTYVDAGIIEKTLSSNAVDATTDVSAPCEIGDVVAVSHTDELCVGSLNAYVSAKNVITLQFVTGASGATDFSASVFLTIFHRK